MPIQARTEFAAALNQIASEKGVEVSVVIEAIEQAALAAYKKDLSLRGEEVPEDFEEIVAKIDPASGEITIHKDDQNITPPGFARIAAQTAKNVIAQRLNEAEKGAIMDEYDKKVGTVISGSIQRQEGNTYYVDLGRTEGLLPPAEQVREEAYFLNQRLKFFIKEIREIGRGPEVIVSRTDPGLVKGLFAMEVPEIQAGTVEIKAIAREAGGRTKIAASSTQSGVDPVGSLVGQKGVRVQAVINELGDEKVDIISYSDEPSRFIASALSPAKDVTVTLDGENQVAKVKVPAAQLSLAIGKGGQNVRLAAKLTGWKIDIEGDEVAGVEGEVKEAKGDDSATTVVADDQKEEKKKEVEMVGTEVVTEPVVEVEKPMEEEAKGEEEVKEQDAQDSEEPVEEEAVESAEEVVEEKEEEVEPELVEDAKVEEKDLGETEEKKE